LTIHFFFLGDGAQHNKLNNSLWLQRARARASSDAACLSPI
jgi:hypothetical protein